VRAFAFPAACAIAVAAAPVLSQPVHYDIAARLDPATRTLAATARITVTAPAPTTLALARTLTAGAPHIDGTPLGAPRERGEQRVWTIPAGAHTIEIGWQGVLAPLDRGLDHRGTLGRPVAASGNEGTFLPAGSHWYPVVGDFLASYRVSVDLPSGQRAVVPGRLIEETEGGGRARAVFAFAHPAEGIDLIAGPYRVASRRVRTAQGSDVTLRTYFHPRIAGLAQEYLDAAQGYLDLYEGWIGPYPFTEFSVVSSPTPTGFGMPTLTYLGERVLELPFIRATSLGHEVLHNWWGNGVYPDVATGNWSEGLTTFMADYTYKERAGAQEAQEMRLNWLRNLAAVPPGQDRPLAAFTSRSHGTSQIVGYDKAAMVFLMLRDMLGAPTFDRALRRFWRAQQFRVASWRDLQRAFEAESGMDLGPFFAQWLERPGVPAVRIAQAAREEDVGSHRVRFTLAQDAPAYRLRVPLRVDTAAGAETHVVELASARQSYTLAAHGRPTRLVLDPDFRVLRRLAAAELPPIVRQTMVAPAAVVAIAAPQAEWSPAATRVAERLLDAKPELLGAHDSPPRDAALVVIGGHAEVDAFLARQGLPARPVALTPGSGSAQAWAAARPGGAPLLVVSAAAPAVLAPVARLLPHYGRQSFLVFEGSRVAARGVWPAPGTGWDLDRAPGSAASPR